MPFAMRRTRPPAGAALSAVIAAGTVVKASDHDVPSPAPVAATSR